MSEMTAGAGYPTDRYDQCFGCGQSHPFGMRMTFTRTGTHEIVSTYIAHATHAGAPGVVHGGLQATLLDEVAGFACHTLDADGEQGNYVTADFSLRYRRPVPTGVALRVVGRIVKIDGDNVHTEAIIELADGTEATLAAARWKRLH